MAEQIAITTEMVTALGELFQKEAIPALMTPILCNRFQITNSEIPGYISIVFGGSAFTPDVKTKQPSPVVSIGPAISISKSVAEDAILHIKSLLKITDADMKAAQERNKHLL